MNLKSILNDLPTFGAKKDSQIYLKSDKTPQTAKETLKKAIPRLSDKRAKEEREYNKEVKVWLLGKMCAVFPRQKATQCHHRKGRIGKLLLDKEFWLPVSDEGHRKIELNPEWARSQGFSLNRFNKNK